MSDETLVNIVFATIFIGMALLFGIVIGRSYQQESDITKYCLYQEYEGSTNIESEYYCYDGDSLFKVEWVK